jgi:hypothetical protein
MPVQERFDSAWHGRLGKVRSGKARPGLVWRGGARFGMAGRARWTQARTGWVR